MKINRNEHGATLVSTLILLSALFGLTIAGLVSSTSSLQVSGNYQQSAQALLAAETGVLHSVATMDGVGVVRLDEDAVAVWSSLFSSVPREMPGHSSITYDVTPTVDATNPIEKMTLTSTGFAPRNAQRQIVAGVELNGAFSPGAIYLPGNSVATTFHGNNFLVDGNDYLYPPPPVGLPLINPDGEDRPGIAVLNPANVAPVDLALNNSQDDNVLGVGGIPSVVNAKGPSASEITNEIAPDILDEPGVVTNPAIHGNDTFGTVGHPQITHFTHTVSLTGNVSGAGILIADQGLTVTGNLEFVGLIIVLGTTEITSALGNATVLGAVWTTNVALTVAGSAGIFYSSAALEAMNVAFGGSIVPQTVKLTSWREL